MNIRVDLEREAPVPQDDHITVVGYRLDDTAVSDDKFARTVLDAQQLDAGAHTNTRAHAGCKKAGTVRIHVGCIGGSGRKLDGKWSRAGATPTASKGERPTGPSEFDGLDGPVGLFPDQEREARLMSGQPRDDREWEHWPHERKLDEGIRHRLRGLFHPTTHGDEAVEEFVAQQGRELELRATQLAETIADLERRENRTSELRVAVEQMLRRGSAELDERHGELAELAARLAEREALAADTERLLAERRTELGAVELRRAALERREAAVSNREESLGRQAADLAEREQLLAEVEQRADELVTRSTEVAAREERLTLATEAIDRDREALTAQLTSLHEREREVVALDEHKRDLEQATAVHAARHEALDVQQAALAEQREELRRAVAILSDTLGLPTALVTPAAPGAPSGSIETTAAIAEHVDTAQVDAASHLIFVPGDRYRLVEAEGRAPAVDDVVELEDHSYRVVRVAPSPLPADERRCAFLEPL